MRLAREMHDSVAGQVAVITGGGSGIGLGCARSLALDGATVVLASRTTERLAGAFHDPQQAEEDAAKLRGFGDIATEFGISIVPMPPSC